MNSIQKIYVIAFVFVAIWCSGFGAAAKNQDYMFPQLWVGFQTEEELTAALDATPDDRETRGKEGVYYFMQAMAVQNDQRKSLLEKSIDTFDTLRKKDRGDMQNMFRLAYAHMAMGGAGVPMDELLAHISKAGSLFNLVIDQLPENIDARLGRIQINVQLPPQAGRPDDLLLEDAQVFLAGFGKLSDEEKQQRPDLEQASTIAHLTMAIVYDARNDAENAQAAMKAIVPEALDMYGLRGKYEELAGKYTE